MKIRKYIAIATTAYGSLKFEVGKKSDITRVIVDHSTVYDDAVANENFYVYGCLKDIPTQPSLKNDLFLYGINGDYKKVVVGAGEAYAIALREGGREIYDLYYDEVESLTDYVYIGIKNTSTITVEFAVTVIFKQKR